MAQQDVALYSLNAGEVSRLALARTDLAKMKMACEQQLNFLPLLLGPCMMRPGLQYIAPTAGNAPGWLGEWYFDENTKALFVMTAGALQFLIADSFLSRVAVATAVANGTFNSDLSSWTGSDESGAVSAWVAGGYLGLTGTGANYAFRDQQVTVAGGDQNKEHALRLVVAHGYASIAIGTAQGDGTYWDLRGLAPGTYSLAFTPTGNFWIRLGAQTEYQSLIDSIAVEAAGTVSLPVPYTTTAQFDALRYDQSGDVTFLACAGFQQRRIERRAADSRSWGVSLYYADDGPFRLGNLDDGITIAPSGTSGSVTLTASRDVFKPTHVGSLWQLTHPTQSASATLGGANQFTGAVRVSGLTASRAFSISVTGTFVATVTLQRSIGVIGSWSDVESYTAATVKTFNDSLDNQIIYYRLGIKPGNYTSGSVAAELDFAGSSQTGIARISAVASAISATADVLAHFGGATATSDWAEGEWSDYRGWPQAAALHDGRLFWEPGIKIQGSVSDAFGSFDATVTGDSGPINRTIATGGLDGGRWLLSLQRLIAGTAAQEISIRASAFDEPLTPTAFVARVCADRGAAKVRPVRVATIAAYVGRNAKRLFKMIFDVARGDYRSRPFDRLKPEMYSAIVRDLAVQRQPDNAQIWAPLGDGSAVVLTYDEDEDVEALVPVTTNGAFERSAVLPGTDEDDVYFIVKRTIGGVDKRYIEKLAKRSECTGGTLSKTVDAHIVYSGAPATTITGLGHLEGKTVVVWGDGMPQVTAAAPLTVTGGQIVGLPVAVSNAVVGLAYTAQLKTVKPAYAAEHGTALTMRKRIARVGLVMADVAWKGVRIGRNFSTMSGLPATYRGKALTAGQVLAAYDAEPGSFNGSWDSDSRVCIQVQSPYCATIMALVLNMTTNEPDDAGEPPPKGGQ